LRFTSVVAATGTSITISFYKNGSSNGFLYSDDDNSIISLFKSNYIGFGCLIPSAYFVIYFYTSVLPHLVSIMASSFL